MLKMDLVKSRKPDSTIQDMALWFQSHPNAQLKLVSQYVANGAVWTSLFYDE
ncbi:MAG: hypothetical protein KGD73_13620 [Candidatus Lokiarchaeota archaeon]|nr:hypothetical protein [Candidatus Lokiarchaeota archaeon]